MPFDPVVIAAAARTPIGSFSGALSGRSAPTLGAAAIRAAVARSGFGSDGVSEVIMGCVLAAGVGQAPARQAALEATPCATLNKLCGSGMKAVMLGHDLLRAGSAAVVVAGGMESMSNAPYLLDKARTGQRLGHGHLHDHLFLDGLEDAYDKGRLMGSFAEDTARHYRFTRSAQDDYALTSFLRAKAAQETSAFDDEIVPIEIGGGTIREDEGPGRVRPERIASLKPAFRPDGTITAANASSISDGAAALVLTRLTQAERHGRAPLAIIRGHASHAATPARFPTAPIHAITKLLDAVGWEKDGVDLYEINEAFAVVAMAAMHDLDLPHDKVNVHGGACALGHPIGASGARIIVTLLSALRRRGLRRGVASLCIGGGEATALALETI
ncbi:acetyl-CoA C-acyltransferase [Methylobacterium frigidaeris]|uniref:Acetyl-CoA acetyltransferase n=1 Tax=Methylobacterium frigidaeris TaxID=2038277 RepID=A0AA37M8X0_9HYPH|nr:Acetyl-CoA acetyltransferase [Methylobacterium frigidaeris]